MIRANDLDIVVLALRALSLLKDQVDALWVSYGNGKSFR
jgi:hypothetical protein